MARKSVVIYAVAEPDPPGRQSGPVRSAPAAALRLKFAGGPDGVAAMYVSPRDSALYLESQGRRGCYAVVPRAAQRVGGGHSGHRLTAAAVADPAVCEAGSARDRRGAP